MVDEVNINENYVHIGLIVKQLKWIIFGNWTILSIICTLKRGFFSADPDTTYEEDMQILRVIEAYCAASSAKQRQTIAASSEFKHL